MCGIIGVSRAFHPKTQLNDALNGVLWAVKPHPKPVKNYLKTSKFTSYRNYFLLLHFEAWSFQIAQVQKASLMNQH